MKKFLILLLIPLITFGEIEHYFSAQKLKEGVLVSLEFTNLDINNCRFQWTFPDITLYPYDTFDHKFFILFKKIFNSLSIEVNLFCLLKKIFNSLSIEVNLFCLLKNKAGGIEEKTYDFKTKIDFGQPEIKIVRKSEGILMPLVSEVKTEDTLVALVKNFSSKKIDYYWFFNGRLISEGKEISLNMIKDKSGIFEVRAIGSSPTESAVDIRNLQIQ